MFGSFSLGRAFGIPIYVHWSFFFLPAWMVALHWGNWLAAAFGLAVLLSIFACVLLHELGHALMARWFGIPTSDITLYPIGGVARLQSAGDRPLQEIAIALAGPAVNLVLVLALTPLILLALLAGWLVEPGQLLGEITPEAFLGAYLLSLWLGNGILLVFNLIPAFPMDGGRVLRALLSLAMGRLPATELAAGIGLILALVLGVVGLLSGNWSLTLVALFVALAGQTELSSLRAYLHLRQPEAVTVVTVPPYFPYTPFGSPTSPYGPTSSRGFTGLAWDPYRGVWVRWVNGRPVSIL